MTPNLNQKTASVIEVKGWYWVEVDGVAIKDASNKPLTLPTIELAEAIAREWKLSV